MKSLVIDLLNMNTTPKDTPRNRPLLVIIDVLDECLLPSSAQDDILKILSLSLEQSNTPLYLLIASRPHLDIRVVLPSYLFRFVTRTLLRSIINPPKIFVITSYLWKSGPNTYIFLHPGQR